MLRIWLEDLIDAAHGLLSWVRDAWHWLVRAAGWVVLNLWTLGKLVIAFLVLMIAITAFGEPVVVEAIDIPVVLKDRVPSGEALSRRIIDRIAVYGRAVQELKATSNTGAPSRNFDMPEIEIPGVGVSLRQAIDVTRRVLGIREYRIAGELYVSETAQLDELLDANVCKAVAPERFLHLRLRSDHGDELFHRAMRLCADYDEAKAFYAPQVDQLLTEASLKVYSSLSPCGAAAYYFRNWRGQKAGGALIDPMMENAEREIGRCLVQSDERQAGYAYYLQGRIRQGASRPEDATRSFRVARDLHDDQFLLRLRDLANRGLTMLGFSPIPSYLPALHVHWGNSLLDQRSPDPEDRKKLVLKAIKHYRQALVRDKGNALAYSGLGNALGELARLERDQRQYTVAAACVYVTGGKRLRFDPDLRHNFGNLYESYGALIEKETASGQRWDAEARWMEIARKADVRAYCSSDPMHRAHRGKPKRAVLVDNYRAALVEAIKNHGKAAELAPDSERFQSALGKAELKLAGILPHDSADADARWALHIAAAERAFLQVSKISHKENFDAWEGLARISEARRDPRGAEAQWNEARSFYTSAAGKRQNDIWLRYNEGRVYLQLKDYGRAADAFRKAIERHPDFAPAYLSLARTLLELQRPGEALGFYDKVVRMDAQSLEAGDRAAMAALRPVAKP